MEALIPNSTGAGGGPIPQKTLNAKLEKNPSLFSMVGTQNYHPNLNDKE